MTIVDKKALRPDLIIAGILLLVFAGFLAASFMYPADAVLLPRLVSIVGILGTAWTVVRSLIKMRTAPEVAEESTAVEDELVALKHQAEEADPDNPEEAFATASRKDWLTALGFAAGFLIVMWLAGIFVATAVFSFAYLSWVGRKKWYFALIYAVVLTGALYTLTRIVTLILTPVGVLLPGG
ncbi:hypothetical protein B5M43_010985 [Microbacterium sp. MEC084]|uniref:tripartite tricarboxylate transporter TctB family protein n=1 Tax=Microbacterium sp. MEC084 TaxID=1963027 RepID=UPI0014304532|nr:tripartite tricarboxylate transporter TctB family protein [Microbacterium sp. MEC084]MCD1269356.1 hypothetical protein [Microbacterium sp. MEC084]